MTKPIALIAVEILLLFSKAKDCNGKQDLAPEKINNEQKCSL